MSVDENFRVCTQFGWEIIEITGPSGVDGTDGMDGINGIDGQDGSDGLDGSSILINVANSTACLNGGYTFDIGTDENHDGVLP